MHTSVNFTKVSLDVGQVSLRRRLDLSKLTTESHDGTPQRQQTSVFSGEILVERLLLAMTERNQQMQHYPAPLTVG